MTLNRKKLSKLIIRKNERLNRVLKEHHKDSDEVKNLKEELDRLVYKYYKTIGA